MFLVSRLVIHALNINHGQLKIQGIKPAKNPPALGVLDRARDRTLRADGRPSPRSRAPVWKGGKDK